MSNSNRFSSGFGFVLASVGSAVGMANIWAFPIRVGQNGGAVFILIYLFFIAFFSWVGLSSEFAIGRRVKTGVLSAFSTSWGDSGKGKAGRLIGWIPLLASMLLATGYAVVVGWVLRTFSGVVSGDLYTVGAADFFGSGTGGFSTVSPHMFVLAATLATLLLGARSIDWSNRVMMPAFFILFLILAVRVAFLPGAIEGYRHLFIPQWEYFFRFNTWVYAMGQALFSLSLISGALVVYGSYLGEGEDIVKSARLVAVLDTVAALVAAIVIIPAGAAFGVPYETGGPGLMFVVLPEVFDMMPFGHLLAAFFFFSVILAGVSSLQSMVEGVVGSIEPHTRWTRMYVVAAAWVILAGAGIFLEDASILGPCLDFASIYALPVAGALGAFSWYWMQSPKAFLNEVNAGASRRQNNTFIFCGRYIYVPLVFVVSILGLFYVF